MKDKANLVIREKNFMNTTITIKAVQRDQLTVVVNEVIEEAFGEFDRIVKNFTRFNENSELSNLNRNSGNWVQISEEFLFLIDYSLQLSRDTNGAFDPTVIDFLEIYGYDKNYDFSKLDHPELNEIVKKKVRTRKSWKDIRIEIENKRVKFAVEQRFDLGGIGKGYAIDCAYNKLISKVDDFLIDAGGDIRCHGLNEKSSPWLVELKTNNVLDPNSTNEKKVIELPSGYAIASSGSWARKFKQFHHLIDPSTGKPKDAMYNTVFVMAPTAIMADGWATALFIDENLKKKLPGNLNYYVE